MEDRPSLQGRRVLVVDADERIHSNARTILEPLGCTVDTAGNGEQALEMVRNSSEDAGYHCVLVDIRLPDISGYEFMLKLRELASEMPLVISASFGYDPSVLLAKARHAGLKHLLFKPFRRDLLVKIIEQII